MRCSKFCFMLNSGLKEKTHGLKLDSHKNFHQTRGSQPFIFSVPPKLKKSMLRPPFSITNQDTYCFSPWVLNPEKMAPPLPASPVPQVGNPYTRPTQMVVPEVLRQSLMQLSAFEGSSLISFPSKRHLKLQISPLISDVYQLGPLVDDKLLLVQCYNLNIFVMFKIGRFNS
jgi:hypothetical protein